MATKKEMDDLKRRFISAETEEERNEIGKEISAAIEQNRSEDHPFADQGNERARTGRISAQSP